MSPAIDCRTSRSACLLVEQLISALSDNMSKFASNLAPSSLESTDEPQDGPDA
ncbi:hypothetical protein [Candidatus Poriferisodalis sp.]|uniref:hypothetical protein n=1 Tax=Candidatus Poriferisodalis sp. TaxID=3101277 RepID=UPI003D09C928